MKKIYLPHINYTVVLEKFGAQAMPHKFAKASTEEVNNNSCTIYLHPSASASTISHEVTHALQFICKARGITFEDELEHVGYMAQYITMCILGGRWNNVDEKKR